MTIRFGSFEIDDRTLRRNGDTVKIGYRQFRALRLLVEADGRTVSRERLLDELWPGVHVEESSLHRCISDLRKLLGERDNGVRYIENVARCGYRFVGHAEPVAAVPEISPRAAWRRRELLVVAATGGAFVVGGAAIAMTSGNDSLRTREARALYLRGRALWLQRSGAAMAIAGELFQQALAVDPTFAPAYAGLADVIATRANAVDVAWDATLKALDFDPMCAEAYASQGFILMAHRWQWAESERRLRRALAIDQTYTPALQWLSLNLAITGRLPEAIRVIDEALRLDPLSPGLRTSRASYLYFGRRHEDALVALAQALDVAPKFPFALQWRAKIEIAMGRRSRGVASWRTASAIMDAADTAVVEWRAIEDESDEAERWLNFQLEAQSAPPIILALYSCWNDDGPLALSYLEAAVEEKALLSMYVPVDPSYDPARKEPGFASILAAVNLPAPDAEL